MKVALLQNNPLWFEKNEMLGRAPDGGSVDLDLADGKAVVDIPSFGIARIRLGMPAASE